MRISTRSPSRRRKTTPPAVYSRSARMRRGVLALVCRFGRRFFFWFIKITVAVDGAEHAINELARIFAAKSLGELYRLVNCHFGRNFALNHELVDTDAQDDLVDLGDLFYGPLGRGRANNGVNIMLVGMHAL